MNVDPPSWPHVPLAAADEQRLIAGDAIDDQVGHTCCANIEGCTCCGPTLADRLRTLRDWAEAAPDRCITVEDIDAILEVHDD